MFDFLTFSAISSSALDFFTVMKTPIAVLIGVGLGLMVLSAVLTIVGIGGVAHWSGSDEPAPSTPKIPRSRRRYRPRDMQKSVGEWYLLEERAKRVNGWDGNYD